MSTLDALSISKFKQYWARLQGTAVDGVTFAKFVREYNLDENLNRWKAGGTDAASVAVELAGASANFLNFGLAMKSKGSIVEICKAASRSAVMGLPLVLRFSGAEQSVANEAQRRPRKLRRSDGWPSGLAGRG